MTTRLFDVIVFALGFEFCVFNGRTPSLLFQWFEVFFRHAADWADPCIGNVFERCSGRNAVRGIADNGIINSRADLADIFLCGRIAHLFHFFDRLEIVFADAANGADPCIGQIFERRSCGNAVFGIAYSGIIDGSADVANVFLHLRIV